MTEINLPQFSDTDTTNIADIVESYVDPYKGEIIEFGKPYTYQTETQDTPSFFGLIPGRTDFVEQYNIVFQDNKTITDGIMTDLPDGITDTIIINDVNGMSITLNDFEGVERGFYEDVTIKYSPAASLNLTGDEETGVYNKVETYDYDRFFGEGMFLVIAEFFGFKSTPSIEDIDGDNDGFFDNANNKVLDVSTFLSAKNGFNQ